jgi:hypothetical protein
MMHAEKVEREMEMHQRLWFERHGCMAPSCDGTFLNTDAQRARWMAEREAGVCNAARV